MRVDDRALSGLVDASQDLHSMAMRQTGAVLAQTVEVAHESRRDFVTRGRVALAMIAGAGVGAALLRGVTPVEADNALDVSMLQTAAAIENLAISVYRHALTLPASVSGTGNPVILRFMQTTIEQHTEHAAHFNQAVVQLGGKTQSGVDTVVQSTVVAPALATLAQPGDVISLVLNLEDAAAETYVKFGGEVSTPSALNPFSVIAPVEAQHVAVLLAIQTLLTGGHPGLIALPTNVANLPAAAGNAGLPASFYSIKNARSETEGAVTS